MSSLRGSLQNNAVVQSEGRSIVIINSNNNIIYSNNVIDSGQPAYDNAENQWHWEGRGNYWSEYVSTDNDSNCIGDSPRHINPNGIDSFPIIQPLTITPVTVAKQQKIPIPPNLPDSTPITDEVVWHDEEITCSSYKLVIERGGSLTLNNMTLKMAEGVDGIYVYPGGKLQVYNSRIITAEGGGGFLFHVYDDAILIMKDSEICGCGIWPWGGDWGGLTIYTETATIENTLITGSGSGVCFGLTGDHSSIQFRNNTISDCYKALDGPEFIKMYESNNTFLNCIQDLYGQLIDPETNNN